MTFPCASLAQQQAFVPDWVKDAVFYQIFPERFANGNPANDPPGTERWGGTPKYDNYFGGDLEGIIQNLDYLSDLGINALYLNPIFESTTNHKYHAKDFMKIDPHFGDEAVFKRLLDSCHARGIRVILDGVWNHTGVDFFAFEDIKKNGISSKYLGWFNIYSLPIAPPRTPNYECWWGLGDLPKLMTHHPDVRNHLFDVTRHWTAMGIDGWRLDVPNEIPHQFWIEWRNLVKSINPDAYIVGEIWEDASPWLKGDQFDAVMNYRFRSACLEYFVDRKITTTRFNELLEETRGDYPGEVNFVLQNLLGSHDTERILTLSKKDKSRVMLATLFQMTYVGAPMVYYGDEIGMEGGKDPDCRRTMVWEKKKQDRRLHGYFKQVIGMRNEHPVLRRGSFSTLLADDAKNVFAFRRTLENTIAVVVLNSGATLRTTRIPMTDGMERATWRQVFPSRKQARLKDNSLDVSIPAMSGVVFIAEREQ
jgi:cyclomaltodextrinase